jgi:hypothetical protein
LPPTAEGGVSVEVDESRIGPVELPTRAAESA